MAAGVVVADCMSSFELVNPRCTNRDFALVREMYGTEGTRCWTDLFMDDAAMTRESEALIPLMVVAGKSLGLPAPNTVVSSGGGCKILSNARVECSESMRSY